MLSPTATRFAPLFRGLHLIGATCCVFLGVCSSSAFAGEFYESIERDFALRSIGQLQVTNMRGSITVLGWAQDKIRVKARRKAIADTEEEAKRLFSVVDFRYRMVDGDIELSAEYGRGLDIQNRLKERDNPKTEMEMTVYAPANLKLRVWAVNGKATVKNWNSPLEVRTASGAIEVEQIRAASVALLCPSCTLQAKAIRGSLRCMAGTGSVAVTDIEGSQIYVESSSGALQLRNIKGEQLYVSKSGDIVARDLRGRIEFHTDQANVDLTQGAGFLSGRSTSGQIRAQMAAWNFSDKALIESESGNIALSLPLSFSGDLDVWSFQGKTEVGFPVEKAEIAKAAGPQPANRILGRVREGGELLKVYSEKGDIRLVRGNLPAVSESEKKF